MDAEAARGRRLVMVGFMRRYDAAYRALRAVLADESIGTPLLVHCAHRNPSVPANYVSEMAINDTAIHEFDVVRWLLDEEIVACRVVSGRRNVRRGTGLQDPILLLLETASGCVVDIEVSVNIGYGYDIRCEVVGDDGTAALADLGPVVVRRGGRLGAAIPGDWRERFIRAYDAELQAWLNAVAGGGSAGPSAWDGFAATAVADACLRAMRTGERVPVSLGERPDFYRK